MKAKGLVGVSRHKACRTASRDESARPVPDLLERAFSAEAPDWLWVGDTPYVPTWEGFLHLAVFGRRVVGLAMAAHLHGARKAFGVADTASSPHFSPG